MADCSNQFSKLLGNISLTDTEETTLRKNRDALRERIKSYFSSRNLNQPTFCGQGSFSMRTTIREPNNEYDIDDGLYLNHLPADKKDWPNTEDIHKLVVDSVDGHTDKKIEDKNKCVRVPYSDGHHVDLAIYGEYNQKHYLAVKGNTQWEENSAKAFKDWFDSKKSVLDDNYVKIIKIIKKWSQKQDFLDDITGFLITILVGNNFCSDSRIDKCLSFTLTNIVNDLKRSKQIVRPVSPNKNLTEKYSDDEFEKKFIKPFEYFKIQAEKAVSELNISRATEIWISLFGTDFPEDEDRSNNMNSTFEITTISKPWSLNFD